MATRRRGARGGGPVPPTGVRASEGARVLPAATPPAQQGPSQAERLRQAMTPSRPGRIRFPDQINVDFFREAFAELRKVNWPTREQALRLTVLVIAVSVLVGMILGGIDYIFEKIFEFILGAG